jgi:hypothetical protein
MTKVNHFALKSKSSEENLFSEVTLETKEQPTCARDCPNFQDCSAPFCPADADSLKSGLWYTDEGICSLVVFKNLTWIMNQKRIAKKARNKDFYFTKTMLDRTCIVTGATEGLDPDKTDVDNCKAVKAWLKTHPEKPEISEDEREKRRNRMLDLKRRLTLSENTQTAQEFDSKVALETGERHTTDESHAKVPLEPYSDDAYSKNAV